MNNFNNCFGTKCRSCSIAWSATLVGMILTLMQSPAFAVPPTPDQVAQSHAQSHAQSRAMLHTYYAWLNASWIGDDHPYQHIRTTIEQEISRGANPFDLLKQREKELDKSPGDFQAQFAYYYTAYQAATWPKRPKNTEFTIGIPILGNLFLVVVRTPPPHTYNYARLAFLCEQYGFIDPNLKTVGLRLVGRDPSDYDVRYYTISSLALSPVPSDHGLALKYAHDLVNDYPNKPSSYSMAASLHYQAWLRTKNKQDATEAISNFQRYLQLDSRNSSYREQAEKYIAQMQAG